MLNPVRTGERFERAYQSAQTGPGTVPHEIHHCGDLPSVDHPEVLPPVKQESVISLKIYDSCRQQDCLDEDELGAARSATCQKIGDRHFKEGEIIIAPDNAASVSVEDLRIKRIIIVNKRHNPFRRGYWDIDLEYVFEYFLVFREARGKEIGVLKALSTFSKKVTLFGSIGSDIVIATDLLSENAEESPTLSLDPFVLVEAKAVALSAKFRPTRHHRRPDEDCGRVPMEVVVTIGLFTIVRLFRLVTLIVESRGFSIPRNCQEIPPVNVCEHFGKIPFPMDVFAPPQKREFEAGITGDIPQGGPVRVNEDTFEEQTAE
jgi:hypothetical protein